MIPWDFEKMSPPELDCYIFILDCWLLNDYMQKACFARQLPLLKTFQYDMSTFFFIWSLHYWIKESNHEIFHLLCCEFKQIRYSSGWSNLVAITRDSPSSMTWESLSALSSASCKFLSLAPPSLIIKYRVIFPENGFSSTQ